MMSVPPVEILLVEDNPSDEELTIHALRADHLANNIDVVRDGAEALDYIFRTGAFAHRNVGDHPKVILLDLKLPKVDGLEVLRRIREDPGTRHRSQWLCSLRRARSATLSKVTTWASTVT